MKSKFFAVSRVFFPLLCVSMLVVACSKNESNSEASSPTATPVISPSPTIAPSATASPTPLTTASPLADLNIQMRDLEQRMDTVFTNAFRNVGHWFDESTLASSVDLREQNDKYIARVYVPHADTSKVDAKIEDGALHITAQGEHTVNGNTTKEDYDQVITLAKPIQADKVQIDRKQNMVVISVPKTTASAPTIASASNPSPTTAPSPASTDWDDIMFNQFAAMQKQMDQALHDVFATDTLNGASAFQLGSAVNVDDQKDKYVVHFYLPERDLSNVKVDFADGRLHLTAEEEKSATDKSANGNRQSTTAGRYEEMVTLAGPVKDKDMKVERKSGAVVVIVPKA